MNPPNLLTLSRIFLVPVLVVVLLTRFPGDMFGVSQQIIGVTLFLVAALTDYFDGWLARKRSEVTTLGILLDPIADKLLVSAALVSLVENHLAPAWAVCIIIGREFAVSGFRSIAASQGFTIPASRMGKLKMGTQVVAISLLILGSVQAGPPITTSALTGFRDAAMAIASTHTLHAGQLRILSYAAGRLMLWIVVVSAIWSMVDYFQKFYGKVRNRIEVRKRRKLLRRRRAKKQIVKIPGEAAEVSK